GMATRRGVILGTAAYMAPEQVKGLPADQRSDVFAFGAVLFEMLAGRQAFDGDTAPEVLASVLAREPQIDRLPDDLDSRLVDLIRRFLDKQPKRRWQATGDALAGPETIAASPGTAPARGPVRARPPLWRRALWPAASAIVVGVTAAAAAWMLKPERPGPIVRFSFDLPTAQVGA